MSKDSWQFLTEISGGFGGIVKLQAFLGVRCIGINVTYDLIRLVGKISLRF